jgi:uncharacterized protein (DUF1330 family)|tara:strand:+ start:4282 stop:4644 length:363 start_codon:yes stop_codon:yes gene_type:complete
VIRALTLFLVVCVLVCAPSVTAQEPPAYIVATVQIDDRETYQEYAAGFGAILGRYDGEIVAVSDDPTILEGAWPETRTVLIRFASRDEALRWYNSDEYQELARIRWSASTADVIVIDGRR